MSNIFVFLELENEKLSDSSKKIIAQGRFIADSIGAILCGFCFQDSSSFNESFEYGVDKLHVLKGINFQDQVENVDKLAEFFQDRNAKLILCADGWISENVFSRLTQKLGVGFVSTVTELQYDATIDNFYFTFESIRGKLISQGTFENPNLNIICMDVRLVSTPIKFYSNDVCVEYFEEKNVEGNSKQ